ncbi:ferrochelatase [Terracidiphilus gabretensis]|uniref:ferrochelatase n=1 Tax=Terracidiphilus gabretensis TaxID=1577687 RepID=UPI00071C0FBF|nr:ferrochelatase [Terracidiphilus gabretensis]
MPKQAVLLLAHGTPETVEQIPDYLRNVVSGRPMPEHVVEEIQHRYSLIGRSPLTELTLQQAGLTEAELARVGQPVQVYVGMRNWRPYIPDVVRQMRVDGVEEAAVICLAPQNSRTSVGLYRRAAQAEAGAIRIDFTDGWADHPLLAEAFAERLRDAQARIKAETGAYAPVLFTAHSVPARTVQPPAPDENQPRHWPGEGVDPYEKDARKTAELVAARVPEVPAWYFAFQSQGASGGPWIGPTVEATLDILASQSVKNLILQPIGFLCDHVEILYDVDIAFKEYAAGKGIHLERPESLNASATLARALANLAERGLKKLRTA